MSLSKDILSDITVHMKYAKYLDDENRRETWEELVTRNMNMHRKKYPELERQIVKNNKIQIKSSIANSCSLLYSASSASERSAGITTTISTI